MNLLEKTIRVISSCKDADQLLVAFNYMQFAAPLLTDVEKRQVYDEYNSKILGLWVEG